MSPEQSSEESAGRFLDRSSVSRFAALDDLYCILRASIGLIELASLSIPERDPVADRVSIR
jgi:hypothetical protein